MSDATSTTCVNPEAGSGLCYSLALFLGHRAGFNYARAEVEMLAAEGAIRFDGPRSGNPAEVHRTIERLAATRWFSNAALPLRSLQIPGTLPDHLKNRLERLRSKSLRWMSPQSPAQGPNAADVAWALDEAKEIIRLIDELHGIHTKREQLGTMRREPVLRFRDPESDDGHDQ